VINDFIKGDSSEAMLMIFLLHFWKPRRRKLRVFDVTYGKGVGWQQIDTSQYDFYASDIVTCKNKYDFRDLPYEDDFMDIGTLDPPWGCHSAYSHIHDPDRLQADRFEVFAEVHVRLGNVPVQRVHQYTPTAWAASRNGK
jgi:hypothetical protein